MPMMPYQKNEKKTQIGTQILKNNNNPPGSYEKKNLPTLDSCFISCQKD
jgi:hypothetical protein